MGIKLVNEVLDHSPADLPSGERLLLVVLAEEARDETRECWPSTERLARRTGLSAAGLTKAFQRLAARGLEVRVSRGVDSKGRQVFAYEGAQRTYRIPNLRQWVDHRPPTQPKPDAPQAPSGSTVVHPQEAEDVSESGPVGGQESNHSGQEGGPVSNLSGWTGVQPLAERVDHSPTTEPQRVDGSPLVGGPPSTPSPHIPSPSSPSEKEGGVGETSDGSIPGMPDAPPSKSKSKSKPTKTTAPDDFAITDAMRAWAAKSEITVDLAWETQQFLDHHGSKGSLFVDWVRAWQTWMRNAQRPPWGGSPRSTSNPRGQSPRTGPLAVSDSFPTDSEEAKNVFLGRKPKPGGPA